jgi:hypothetical protein
MKYQIVSVSGITYNKVVEKLVKEVNAAMAIGWEPLGGVVIIGSRYAQTMVKHR